MSRCFPFPPPGYEKEPKPEDAGLLKEEKHKEKNCKKDKKDKEKREGKEKKEKDRSDRKHKEKKEKKNKHKDKKEKHRDKKDKNKDKEKEKERSSISEEARLAGHPGASSADPRDKDEQNSGIFSVNKKYADEYQGQCGQKPVQTSIPDREIEESKFVQELGRRIKDDEKGEGNHLAGSIVGNFGECKRDEMMDRLGINDFGNFGDNTEKIVGNSVMGAQATWNRSVHGGNATAPNFSEASKSKVEGMPRRMEENNERKVEKEKPKRGDEKLGHKKEKEKTKAGDEKLGHKNKDNERDKKSQRKDKDKEKEKEKAKEKNKLKNSEQDRFRNISKNDSIVVTNSKTLHVSGDNNDAFLEGNIRKRKDFESNGFLHESEIRSAKLPRHIPLEIIENGSKVEPPQIPHTSARQGGGSDIKVTEHKINGKIQDQLLSSSRPKPSPMITGNCQIAEASRKPPCSNEIAEASKKPPHPNQIDETSKKPAQPNQITKTSKKPPHPDLKYLSQILSVPKMEEWNEYDEQEWLVGSKDSSGTKPKNTPNEEQLVWSEARYISPEIVALPYVIPY